VKCKRCKKETEDMARVRNESYIICWDCLIELDINHKDYKKYLKTG